MPPWFLPPVTAGSTCPRITGDDQADGDQAQVPEPVCSRRTFAGSMPEVTGPTARRTSRVSEIVRLLGHNAGGRPSGRLLACFGMAVSGDTVLRHGPEPARDDREATRPPGTPAARKARPPSKTRTRGRACIASGRSASNRSGCCMMPAKRPRRSPRNSVSAASASTSGYACKRCLNATPWLRLQDRQHTTKATCPAGGPKDAL